MIGKTLGHYQVTSQIGKGGMGEVFQAKDQKLGRDVAIKVLPDEFARDSGRVARFQREAKVLASLNHPNIAAIYGLEESAGTNLLVMELVEGQTLADQIKTGPIPVEEALKLALQISEALEAAHEKGVIHRDLKPGNIKVTPDGKVKVLDFGLAKAYAGEQEELNLSNSPTLSNVATQQGFILGTAAYMSPEQARGKAVDKRADIWAFGCVVFEMLTGQAAFQGEDVTEILAAVVKGGSNLDLLPANLHPRVREVITRCLQKDVKKRYSSITDARYEIEQALADPSGVLVQPTASVKPRRKLRLGLPWVAAAIILTAIIAGLAGWKLKLSEARQVVRFDYEPLEGLQFNRGSVLAVSPDGKQFVYSTLKGLYMRSIDEWTAKFIAGTEGEAQNPFFSPDGKWIGYFSATDHKLKKVTVNGGAAVALCDVPRLTGASWSEDNTIVYGQYPGEIMRISANGGTPESVVKPKPGVFVLATPQILPDGKSILYTSYAGVLQTKIMVQSLKSGESKELFTGAGGHYLPTGHIVYALRNNNNLFGIAFDLDRLEVKGGPVAVVEGVRQGQSAISDSGTLVYMPGTATATAPELTLVWVDRNGNKISSASVPGSYRNFRLSGDGKRIVFDRDTAESNPDIWVLDLVRGVPSRLTFDPAVDNLPIWSSDGLRVLFPSNRSGSFDLYLKNATGAGQEQVLIKLGTPTGWATDWSRDGRFILYQMPSLKTRQELWVAPQFGDRKPFAYLQSEFNHQAGTFSPDGRWIAYASDESGRNEIYVQSFPLSGSKFQISTGGGSEPYWRKDGTELFYVAEDRNLMAVPTKFSPTFEPGLPKQLMILTATAGQHSYAVSADGQRFLVLNSAGLGTAGSNAKEAVSRTPAAATLKINVVLNWTEELKQRVPVK